jgi:hypothetical protein
MPPRPSPRPTFFPSRASGLTPSPPPAPFASRASGQGSLEYVGLLTLVGALLALAGPVAGLPGVGTEVARAVRTGICIVGGDVCRSSDAAREGLAPCVVSDRRRGGGAAATVFFVKVGDDHQWTVAQRSDGSVLVTRQEGGHAGVAAGVGLEYGALRLGAEASASLTVGSGATWEFRDPAAAARFLAAVKAGREERWPPAWRFGDVGAVEKGSASLGAGYGDARNGGSADVAGIEASTGSALGMRVGRGETTIYVRTETSGPEASDPLGHSVGVGSIGPVLVEYTRARSGPRELAFHTTAKGSRPGQVVEVTARLDLRDPVNRQVAGRLLRVRAPWPPAMRRELVDVIRYTVAAGTVERSVYAVTRETHGLSAALRLGLELGVELETHKVVRRLVEAVVRTPGSGVRSREDCVA